MFKADIRTITPEVAKKILGNAAPNRNLRKGWISALATLMREGKWQENLQTIVISETGKLLDGQHRLHAIIESGKHVRVLVAEGAPDNSIQSMDTGRARSAADVLGLMGIPNPMAMAATIQQIYLWKKAGRMGEPASLQLARSEIAFASQHIDLEYIQACHRAAHRIQQGTVSVPASFLTACGFIAGHESHGKYSEFCDQLASGANLQRGEPALALREWLIRFNSEKVKASRNAVALVIARAWGAFFTGEKTHIVKYHSDYQFPKIPVGKNVKTPW